MATSGFFTYHDLYAGQPAYYYQQNDIPLSSSTPVELLSISVDADDISFPDTKEILFSSPIGNSFVNITGALDSIDASFLNTTDDFNLISSTTIKSNNKLYELIQSIPFAYFHWLLIGLAVAFTILLAFILTCYCRSHCRKTKKPAKEKKQPFPNFYRYLASNRQGNATSVYDTTTPHSLFSSSISTQSSALKSDGFNKQLLRKGLDAVGSPHVPRIDISEIGSSGNSATDLISEIKTRINKRGPSESTLKKDRVYETQRANMALNSESKRDSSLRR